MLVTYTYDKINYKCTGEDSLFSFDVDGEITLGLLDKRNAEELLHLINYSRDELREWLGGSIVRLRFIIRYNLSKRIGAYI